MIMFVVFIRVCLADLLSARKAGGRFLVDIQTSNANGDMAAGPPYDNTILAQHMHYM